MNTSTKMTTFQRKVQNVLWLAEFESMTLVQNDNLLMFNGDPSPVISGNFLDTFASPQINDNNVIFPEDGVPAHYANLVTAFLM